MSNRLFNPDIQYCDATGAPYAGAQLFFYASGTSTKITTYSDAALTIANPNPIILDSAGRAGPIFLQTLQYKVLLAPSTDTDPPTSPIWTQDPVYTSDYSTAAQFQSGSGSPNGSVAGNAGTATIKASSYWDYTNQILYVCTTTGTASTAVWTAINASTAAAVVVSPQGRLTLTSGVPVLNTDVVAATAVYYTPYTGLLVPIYNGTTFVPTSIVSELQYTLTSNLAANNIYDLFVFSNSGVPTLGSGPSWAAGTGGSVTAGSCVRGTGAGGAALSRVQGIMTNAASMTIRYGDGTKTASVNANQATYVGSLYMDSTNGQVSCYVGIGQSRKWGVWNAYNRMPVVLQVSDPATSWTYGTSAWHESDGQTTNFLTVFSGLPENYCNSLFKQMISTAEGSGGACECAIGIGVNSTSSPTALFIKVGSTSAVSGPNHVFPASAEYIMPPSLGINNLICLENGLGSTSNVPTFYGTSSYMLLTATFNA